MFEPLQNIPVDARDMFGDARKLQKCKVSVKGFQTHLFWSVLVKNSPKYDILKLADFGTFFGFWRPPVVRTYRFGSKKS